MSPLKWLARCLGIHEAREWLPSPRSWYECRIGPLPWHIPGTRASRIRRRWFRFCGRITDTRWRITAAILNKVATPELRHAALLLGADLSYGFGREGFLGHLHEFSVGNEIGDEIVYGDAAERAAGREAFNLERSLYGVSRLRLVQGGRSR